MNDQLQGYAPLKKAKKMEQNITFLGASYSRPLTIEGKYLVEEVQQTYSIALNISGSQEERITSLELKTI